MKLFKHKFSGRLARIPSGAFALDRHGKIVASTLPGTFPESAMRDIGERVLTFFRGAEHAQLPLNEVNVYYPSLRVTARNLRGGALIFLLPQTLSKS